MSRSIILRQASSLLKKPVLARPIKPCPPVFGITSGFKSTPYYNKKKPLDIKDFDQSGDDPIIGFKNPQNFFEKVVFGLGIHRIPQVVFNRQINQIYLFCESVFEDNKEFFTKDCGLPDNFQTWFSITQLHIWIAMVRVRAEPNARKINQNIVNRFFNSVEHKIRDYGVTSDRIVAKTAKDLIEAFRGGNLAYDEGMCKSDAVLAAALWRNLFTTSTGSVKGKQIAYMVRYVRQQLKHMEDISPKLVYNGIIVFTPPETKL